MQLLCPRCVPQVTRLALRSKILQSKGSGWQDAPRSWVVQLQGAGLQLAAEPQSQRGKAAAASVSSC